jgi:hypothetical protein
MIVDFVLPSDWWVSSLLMHELKHEDIGNSWFCYSKNPNSLLYFLGLRSWGLSLTIVGGQPKKNIVASIVYAHGHCSQATNKIKKKKERKKKKKTLKSYRLEIS